MTDVRYIYRLEVRPNRNAPPEHTGFLALQGLWDGVAHLGLLRREFGWSGALKALLKLATGRRSLFGFARDGGLISYLWSTERSPRYPIEGGACVLGPLLTRMDLRGRGLATALLRLAADRLSTGYRMIYIDTTPSNIGSRRAIIHANFVAYAVLRGARLRILPRGPQPK
jgi:hypothetical protein